GDLGGAVGRGVDDQDLAAHARLRESLLAPVDELADRDLLVEARHDDRDERRLVGGHRLGRGRGRGGHGRIVGQLGWKTRNRIARNASKAHRRAVTTYTTCAGTPSTDGSTAVAIAVVTYCAAATTRYRAA